MRARARCKRRMRAADRKRASRASTRMTFFKMPNVHQSNLKLPTSLGTASSQDHARCPPSAPGPLLIAQRTRQSRARDDSTLGRSSASGAQGSGKLSVSTGGVSMDADDGQREEQADVPPLEMKAPPPPPPESDALGGTATAPRHIEKRWIKDGCRDAARRGSARRGPSTRDDVRSPRTKH